MTMEVFGPGSWLTLVILVCSLVGVAILSIWFVPYLAKRGSQWKARILQGIALALVALLSPLAFLVRANIEFSWIENWNDLWADPTIELPAATAPPPQPLLSSGHAGQDNHYSDRQRNPRKNPLLARRLSPTRGAQYLTVTVRLSSGVIPILIYLPPSYLSRPDRGYPVIMGFTGYPGDIRAYKKFLNMGQAIPKMAKRGKVSEAIVVVPAVLRQGFDSECVDGTRANIETLLARDLVHFIRSNFRTLPGPESWATMGYSAGGWCAAMMTTRHPDIFGAAINLSGYFQLSYSPGQKWTDPKNPKYQLEPIIERGRYPVHFWYFSSKSDKEAMASLEKFRRHVHAPTTLEVTLVPTGGHNPKLWSLALEPSLEWLGRTMAGFVYRG